MQVAAHNIVVFSDGDSVEMENVSNEKTRFLLIAGEPTEEPIVQHGKGFYCFRCCRSSLAHN